MFWTDGLLNRIESSDFNGGNRQVLAYDTDALINDIVVHGQYLYYTAWHRQLVHFMICTFHIENSKQKKNFFFQMCKDQELCMKLYMSIHVNNYFPSFSVTGKSLKWIREQDQKFNSCQTIPNLGDLTAWIYMQMNFETVIQYHFNVCLQKQKF